MKLDGFLLTTLAAVILALLWPVPGTATGFLHLPLVTAWGIGLIFFMHGVMLSPHAVFTGLAKWRLHAVIQCSTFVVFPLLGAVIYAATRNVLVEELRIGVFLLCALSSTISSSVALTAMARGDVASAVFNASASSLIGMIVTPLWMHWIAAVSGASMPLWSGLQQIFTSLALPFVAGQLLRPWLIALLLPYKKQVNLLDRSVIVLIVYASFCEATAQGIWQRFSYGQLAIALLLVTVLLGAMLIFTTWMARLMGFSRDEEVAVVFCGSKKSLAGGAPMARVLFAAHPGLALIMLPLMLYHQIQLLACTLLARRYAAAAEQAR